MLTKCSLQLGMVDGWYHPVRFAVQPALLDLGGQWKKTRDCLAGRSPDRILTKLFVRGSAEALEAAQRKTGHSLRWIRPPGPSTSDELVHSGLKLGPQVR